MLEEFPVLCFFLIIFSLVGTTLAHYHTFIAQVLKHAVAVGDVLRNPLGGMRAPKRRPKPVNSLTPDKVAEVSTKLNNMGPTPLAIAARLALMTGMRRGEICALRWQDVNLSKRQIHVVHALSKAKGFVMDTPKDVAGKDSRRTISFGPRLAKIRCSNITALCDRGSHSNACLSENSLSYLNHRDNEVGAPPLYRHLKTVLFWSAAKGVYRSVSTWPIIRTDRASPSSGVASVALPVGCRQPSQQDTKR
jgi:integrase